MKYSVRELGAAAERVSAVEFGGTSLDVIIWAPDGSSERWLTLRTALEGNKLSFRDFVYEEAINHELERQAPLIKGA